MATRSVLALRKSLILTQVQRNLATSSVLSHVSHEPQKPEYRPGFLKYIFWIPYNETNNQITNHG